MHINLFFDNSLAEWHELVYFVKLIRSVGEMRPIGSFVLSLCVNTEHMHITQIQIYMHSIFNIISFYAFCIEYMILGYRRERFQMNNFVKHVFVYNAEAF